MTYNVRRFEINAIGHFPNLTTPLKSVIIDCPQECGDRVNVKLSCPTCGWQGGKTYRVYILRFADGWFYVGQTSRKINERINTHKDHRGVVGVWERLNAGIDYEVSEVFQTYTLKDALRHETYHIDRIKNQGWNIINKVLDTTLVPKHPQWPHIPRDNSRLYHCYVCRDHRPALYFGADRSRSTGRASKCKDCAHWLKGKLRDNGDWQKNKNELMELCRVGKRPDDWGKSKKYHTRKEWKDSQIERYRQIQNKSSTPNKRDASIEAGFSISWLSSTHFRYPILKKEWNRRWRNV